MHLNPAIVGALSALVGAIIGAAASLAAAIYTQRYQGSLAAASSARDIKAGDRLRRLHHERFVSSAEGLRYGRISNLTARNST